MRPHTLSPLYLERKPQRKLDSFFDRKTSDCRPSYYWGAQGQGSTPFSAEPSARPAARWAQCSLCQLPWPPVLKLMLLELDGAAEPGP